MATIDLGVPGVEVTEDEDFVELRLGEQRRIFYSSGPTEEDLRKAALEMVEKEAQPN